MNKLELRLSLLSIIVGLVGITVTLYTLLSPSDSPKNFTFINSPSPLSRVVHSTSNPLPANGIKRPYLADNKEAYLDISATGAAIKILQGSEGGYYK